VEGRGQVTIRDLVRNALRMRPDRIIVGECRGGEALDMLQAMNTGHDGSLTTVHANTTDDALSRMETLASMSDVEIPFQALREQVNSSIDIVVQLLRSPDGARRIVDVGFLSSRRREDFQLTRLVHWDTQATGPAGANGSFVRHAIPALLATRLRNAGEAVPEGFVVEDPSHRPDQGGGMPWS
jgi:pilus assembly protein CpaF